MKRKLYVLISCALTILLLFSTNIKLKSSNFNGNGFIDNINYLSSDFYQGRLLGTIENEYAAYFLKQKLEKIGIETTFEEFTALCPELLKGKPSLIIKDKNGQIKKEYEYGIDFHEDMGSFKKTNVVFSNKDKISKNDYFLQVFKGDDSFLLLSPKDEDISFRSSFIKDSPFSLIYILKKDILKEVNSFLDGGYLISLNVPVELKQKIAKNVVGKIKGRDISFPPLVLSAHFDHVGTDFNGVIYSGALDNASGVSMVLTLAEYIKTLGKPKGDIYIVFFNGEESGFLGSYDFCNSHLEELQKGRVLNFDMIGSSIVPLCIMEGDKDSPLDSFPMEISNICRSNKLYFNYSYQNSSDHTPFRENKINAITFCDEDTSKIHTPKDKGEFINVEAGERCFKVASKSVIAYDYPSSIVYNINYLIYLALGLLILFIILIIDYSVKSKFH